MSEDKALIAQLVMKYADACRKVMNALEAAWEPANKAVRTRKFAMSAGIDANRFMRMAQKLEEEFLEIYQDFEDAKALASQAGAELVAACQETNPAVALSVHLLQVAREEELLEKVISAGIYLRARFTPSPEAFIDEYARVNAAFADGTFGGDPVRSNLIFD